MGTNDDEPNREQAILWNEQAGPRWVAMQSSLDAELEQFGVALASKLTLASGERVLDVGCGAGATSLMLAERVRPGEVVGADISAPLLARAKERGAAFPNLRFELADAQTFAFDASSFDVVFSRFGVMFFGDPVAAFRNLHRATRPGGRVGFVCWRPMRENPSFTLPLEAALPFLPEPPPPPNPGAPGPFAFDDEKRVRTILESAGWVDVHVAPHDTKMIFGGRSELDAAVDLSFQVGPLSRALPKVPESMHGRIRDAVREAFARHHGPEGVSLAAATWLVTARRG